MMAPDPGWQHEHGHIRLSGAWSLVIDERRRQRLLREFAQLAPAEACHWDLRAVNALDSTGALLLWEAWGGHMPGQLDCSREQRKLFEWLAGTQAIAEPANRVGHGGLESLGRGVLLVVNAGAGIALLAGQVMLDSARCVRHPRVTPWLEISANIHRIGANAMLLLGSIGFLIGAVMTIQVGLVLQTFGATGMVIGMMATAVPRELGAVVTGLLMAARTGSAMTASIATMRITEEYSALETFGASSSLRLALPRVVGAAIAMPLLVIWTGCALALGGAVAAQAGLGIDFRLFLVQLLADVQLVNCGIGIGKGVLFGAVIALVGCHFGMTSAPDTASMSRHTTLSVVTSLTAILLLDAALGAAMTHVGLL